MQIVGLYAHRRVWDVSSPAATAASSTASSGPHLVRRLRLLALRGHADGNTLAVPAGGSVAAADGGSTMALGAAGATARARISSSGLIDELAGRRMSCCRCRTTA